MSKGKQGDKPSLPRNCEGNESPIQPLSFVMGWEGRQVGRPESGDPGHLIYNTLRGKRRLYGKSEVHFRLQELFADNTVVNDHRSAGDGRGKGNT